MLFVNEIELTAEEKDYTEKIYLLFENNMEYYVRWFEPEHEHHIKPFSKELQAQVRAYMKNMTLPQLTKTSRLHGMNVLHHLVVKNMKEEVRWLIEQGADPNSRCVHTPGSPASFGYKNMTPLHFACILGNYEMVELLVSLGADPTLVDENERGCQHYLGGVVNQVSVGRFLCKEVTPQREQIARFLKLDMNKLDKNGWSPFNYVCKTGQSIDGERIKRMTEIYLELGMDPSKPSSLGIPLCYAISDRSIALFGMMARTGAPLDIQDENGDTLAHWVVNGRNGDEFLVYLYYKGVDFSIPNKKGETVNDYLERVDKDIYKILLKAEKKKTIEDYIKLAREFDRRWDTDPICDEMRCLFVKKAIALIDPDDNKEVLLVKKLIKESGDITDVIQALHEYDFDFRMPLFENKEVTYLRDLILDFSEYWSASVPKLIECGVDINEALDGKTSPVYNMIYNSLTYSGYSEKNLIGAIKYFSPEALDMPCEKGASALHLLSAMGEIPEVLEEALSTGADVNATAVSPARDGDTPLHVACRTKNLPMIQVLVSAGADDTLTNDIGDTPAHCVFAEWTCRYYSDAEKYGTDGDYIRVARKPNMGGSFVDILHSLENIDIVNDNNGMTPAMIMAKNGELTEELLEVFIDYGIDVNRKNDNGDTMLIFAAKASHDSSMVKLLYNEDADVNAVNKDGDSALMWAIRKDNAELARYLIRKGADYNIVNNKKETPAGLAIQKDMGVVLQLMTDIRVIDDSDSENTELTEEEKLRAWKEDYGEERDVFDKDGFFEDEEDDDDYDEDEDEEDEEDEEYDVDAFEQFYNSIQASFVDNNSDNDDEDEDEYDEEDEDDDDDDDYEEDKEYDEEERFATLMTPLFARFNHRMSVKLTPVREKTTVFDSKLGGVPYMPKDFAYPTVKEGEHSGKPLRFLAQLNFNTLPHLEFFPRKGILQFFAGCDGDELYGLDYDNSAAQNCWRVIYHSKITEDVTQLYSAEDMPEFKDADNYPFEGEFLLKNSNPSLMKLTSTDYRFEEAFVSACNEAFGTSYERVFGPYGEKSVFHCEEALCDKVYETMQEQMNEYGTRMGGYPYFTQEDPRSQNDSVKRDILLLQIDSDDEIMWGDCGVANFFISEEDLEDKDFSNVLYNWDCC